MLLGQLPTACVLVAGVLQCCREQTLSVCLVLEPGASARSCRARARYCRRLNLLAAQVPNVTVFSAAVEAAGLDDLLDDPNAQLTVFAPRCAGC